MKANLKKIVEQADEAFAQNKPDDFLSLCADEIEWRMVGEKTVRGKSEARKWIEMGMANVSSDHAKVICTNIIEEDQYVAAYGKMEVKKNEVVTKFSYCDIYRFKDDKIVELTSFIIQSEVK